MGISVKDAVFLATLDTVLAVAVFLVLRLSEAIVAGVAVLECDRFFPMNVRKKGMEQHMVDVLAKSTRTGAKGEEALCDC